MCDQAETNGADNMLAEHQQEIQRRSSATTDIGGINPPSFPRAKVEGAANIPFKDDAQRIILFSVSHVLMPPIAKDPWNPAIRFYGTFASQDDAIEHGEEVERCDPSVNVQMWYTHSWNCMSFSAERILNEKEKQDHIDKRLNAYKHERNKNQREFDENVSKQRGGNGSDGKQSERAAVRKAKSAEAAQRLVGATISSDKVLKKSKKLSRTAEVRNQSFVVVSFLHDTTQDIPEPLFHVYGTFDTEERADLYVRNTVGEEQRDFDVVVCNLYEWLFPQDADSMSTVTDVYRSKELNNIMDNHKSQPAQVEAYKKWRDSSENAESCDAAPGLKEEGTLSSGEGGDAPVSIPRSTPADG
tara:strand:- start:537 stop:1607 length:1071 start_codon:yes stop_codon:yes gene_type:complete